MSEVINYDELDYKTYIVDEASSGERLDKFLASKEVDYSRSYLQDLIKNGYVFVNNNQEKASYAVNFEDEILIYYKQAEELNVLPENIPLDIIYQDKDFAIINKPVGMVVHPSAGHHSGTLVNAIMYHIKDLSTINGVFRPGIVHRIDMDTSGLLAIAKNDNAHNFLANQLKDHSMSRTYICLVKGILETRRGMIKTNIDRDKKNRLKMSVVNDGGKEAITEFEVIETFGDKFSLVKCHLRTGRTHQIRVHMNFIKHPIINDPLYGENNKIEYKSNQLLHAYQLELISPSTNQLMKFEAPLPDYFNEALEFVKNKVK